MPNLEVRKASEVPMASKASRSVRAQQALYEGFIRQLNGDVGELELSPTENIRSVKVRLRRAATRLAKNVEIWDANGKVYFKAATVRRRGRPAKAG